MTEEQIFLVQRSLNKILSKGDIITELFYKRMYEIAPYLRPKLEGRVKVWKYELIHTLLALGNHLGNAEALQPIMNRLYHKQIQFGIEESDYDIFAFALFWTLENSLGSEFTPELQSAWTASYVSIVEMMRQVHNELQTTV